MNNIQTENPEKKKPKCYNCKFSGQPIKIADKTYMHCCHPKYTEEGFINGEWSAWDTLMEFWHVCENHEFKEPVEIYKKEQKS